MKILFATANKNKVIEIQNILPKGFEILSLNDIDLKEDIPETAETIEGNAIQKIEYIKKFFGIDCFADDSGLEIESLNGEPGVYSARYAGNERDSNKNMDLVLEKMHGLENRNARFKTVIALNLKNKVHVFEGIVDGIICTEKRGLHGFGYDPIFEPNNCGKTFAEMTIDEKNLISHRSIAFEKMLSFLNSIKK